MTSTVPSAEPRNFSPCLLRQADQAALAVFAIFALMGIWGWMLFSGGVGHGLTDADHTIKCKNIFQVDVNSAGRPELTLLPAVGDSIARRIVEKRETSGPFTEPNDLRKVKGIGPKTLERIRPHLLPMQKD
jgi:competence protein ComEA